MRIDSPAAFASPAREARAVAGEQLQVVFSEVLEQVGRSGYASADAYQSPNPVEHDIRHGWSDWFAGATQDGAYASGPVGQDALEQRYGDILVRSSQEGGYHDPQEFLQRLSQDELNVVQQVHHLADPIAVDSLSGEGALNLQIPPPAQVDANRDGLTQVGAGSMIRFPDSETPASVVAAWNEATAGMDPQEKMRYEFRMKLPTLLARLPTDGRGTDVDRYAPSPPGFVNPMALPSFSYLDLTQQALDALERFRNQTPPEQYARQTDFWTRFRGSLQKHDAP